MNKTVLVCSAVIMVIFFNLGLSLRNRTQVMIEQKQALVKETSILQVELREKERLPKKKPKALADAFTKVINEMNSMSTYSGLNMAFVFPPVKDQNNIESLYKSTVFRGIKGLPLDIKILKVGAMADVGSAMSAVYLLERQTDFKVTEVSQDSQEIRVKGMLYGI